MKNSLTNQELSSTSIVDSRMDSSDLEWTKELMSAVSKEFIERILVGERGQVPFEKWEIGAIREGLANGMVKFEKDSFQLPHRSPWCMLTLNREYFTHVAAYVELAKQFGRDNVVIEKSCIDLVVTVPPNLVAVEIKKSVRDGDVLIREILKILPTPDLQVRDRGNDALRKAKALLQLRASHLWIFAPSKRWYFEVTYGESGSLAIRESAHAGLQ